MPNPPRKNPFGLFVPLAPKATPEDEAEARRLGVTIDEYRATKVEVQFEQARQALPMDPAVPDDITAEQRTARRLHLDPGIVKPRNTAPNILVQAVETPGEVARTILFVFLYVVGLAAFVIIGGERVQKMEGIFQCVLLGLLLIPVWWLTNRIWEGIGERARDAIRALVRFWPLTLLALFFALVLLKALKQQQLR